MYKKKKDIVKLRKRCFHVLLAYVDCVACVNNSVDDEISIQ